MTLLNTQLAVFVMSDKQLGTQQMERQQPHRAATLNTKYLVIQQKSNQKTPTKQPRSTLNPH